jgi:predicted DNA-binding protein with PD1-like motif
MKNKLIGEASQGAKATAQKTFAIIFNTGDEVVAGLKAFAAEKGLAASHFAAIGAFKNVVLGYFDWEKKDYTKIPIREQVEVLSLVGDVTLDEGSQIFMRTLCWANRMAALVAGISSRLKYDQRSKSC